MQLNLLIFDLVTAVVIGQLLEEKTQDKILLNWYDQPNYLT